MKKKRSLLIVMMVLFLALIAGCGTDQGASKSSGDSEGGIVPFYTTPTGGVNYILAAGMSQLFNQAKILPSYNVVTEATSGSTEAVLFLAKRFDRGELAFASVASDAVTQI